MLSLKFKDMDCTSLIKMVSAQFIMYAMLTFPGLGQSDFDKMLDGLYRKTVPAIESKTLKQLIATHRDLIILDTRSEKEFVVSHLDGAKLIDYESFGEDKVNQIPKDAKVVVYCSVGYRSERIGEKLLALGYRDVSNLYGGIFMWKNESNKVVDPKGIQTDYVHTFNRSWSKWLKNGIKVYE